MTLSDPTAKHRLFASAPAIALAIVATILLLDMTRETAADWRTMFVVAIGAAWPATIAAAIFASARGWSLPRDLSVQIASGAIAAAIVCLPTESGLFYPTYFMGLTFALLAAPLGRLKRAECYWPWVEKLCFAAALASLCALVGFAAVLMTLLSAATLFGLEWLTYGAVEPNLASVMFGAVAPIVFLALRPPVVETTLDERESDLVRRATAALACYALAPFVLVYSALLWIYAGKIALERSLPMGQVGTMVGAFGFIAILTILLIFPERRRGPFPVRWLWRIWPWLLPAPLVLLGFAIDERVATYGMTPDRYVAIVLAVLCAAAGLAALGDRDRVIRFAPSATALALLAASLGPFGAVEASLRWQSDAILSILSTHGLLRPDGRLVEDGPPAALSEAETRKWRAATGLLRQFDRAPPGFGPEAPKPVVGLERLEARVVAAKVSARSTGEGESWRMLNEKSWVAASDGALDNVSIIGAVVLPPRILAAPDAPRATLDGTLLTVESPGDAVAMFDLAPLARRLDKKTDHLPRPQIVEASGAGGFRLLVQQLTLRVDDHRQSIEAITALVLKTRAAAAPAPEHSR